MTTEARRTLVVDLDQLEQHRDGLRRHAEQFPALPALRSRAEAIEGVIQMGTTVPLDHLTVVELATPEREQHRIYSEAQAAEEAELGYDPSCACNYCWASRNAADSGLSPAGGAA